MSETEKPWQPGDPIYTEPVLPLPLLFRPGNTQIGTRSTPRDLVRLIKPTASDDECDYLLWEHSCFPLGTVNQWFTQVRAAITEQADQR